MFPRRFVSWHALIGLCCMNRCHAGSRVYAKLASDGRGPCRTDLDVLYQRQADGEAAESARFSCVGAGTTEELQRSLYPVVGDGLDVQWNNSARGFSFRVKGVPWFGNVLRSGTRIPHKNQERM